MMKIEIWSDVVCPFCYIGKRNLELALAQFPQRNQLEITWKSFVLDPHLPETAEDSYADYLVKRKGLALEQVNGMIAGIIHTAKNVGLHFDFDRSVLVNSHKAHQLIQFAKTKTLGQQAEEVLFEAFFVNGQDTAHNETLLQLGEKIGLDKTELRLVLENKSFSEAIEKDIDEARKIGVNGVPFFLINQKYAISGAQPPEVFLSTITKAFEEWQRENPANNLEIIEGQSCGLDGNCQ